MTPTEIQRVREAAERVLRHAGKWEQKDTLADDIVLLANFALGSVRADDRGQLKQAVELLREECTTGFEIDGDKSFCPRCEKIKTFLAAYDNIQPREGEGR